MAQFSMTKRVAAPVDRVFDVATDLEHAAERIRGIERIELLTDGPTRVGTRWRETRKMMGHESTETLEIVALDRPRSYSVGCESCGAYFETTFRFAPDGDGTIVTLDARTEARSFLARLMSPIGKMMFSKMMGKCVGADLEDLARAAEGRV
ncbi:MAG: SRPBCC family protein [Pirellulales bacterium]